MSDSIHKKVRILFIITSMLLMIFGCGFSCINAYDDSKEQEKNEFFENQKYIEEYITNIKENIAKIDEVILQMKSQKEYEKYPAVRLNVQTPFVGISAIVENKLIVKENVSIFDTSKKYSIRTIVSKRKFKIPSFTIGDIVILTEEIDLDSSTLTAKEQNLVLNSLKTYLKRTQETLEFVNNQKNNIFREYIPKDITSGVQKLKDKISSLQKELVSTDNYMLFIYFQDESKLSYIELNEKYTNIYNKCTDILEKLDDILISRQEVENIENELKNITQEYEKYREKLEYIYDNYKLNVSYLTHLNSIDKELQSNIDFIDKFVLSSTSIEEIQSIKLDQEMENNIYNEFVTYQVKENYDVKRKDLIEKIKDFKLKIEKEIDLLKSSNSSADGNKERVYEDEEYLNKVLNIQSEYTNIFKNCIKVFYEENYQNIIKNCSNKIEKISKYTDALVARYMKDIYFDIPQKIDESNKYLPSFILYMDKWAGEIQNSIDTLIKHNISINEIYDDQINSGNIKS